MACSKCAANKRRAMEKIKERKERKAAMLAEAMAARRAKQEAHARTLRAQQQRRKEEAQGQKEGDQKVNEKESIQPQEEGS